MVKRGAEDSGRYFRYMAEFVGFTPQDAERVHSTRPIIELYIHEIVSQFYTHLLRYPPTRRFFMKKDGTLDQPYLELRMKHLANFWLRTASGIYDDDYARYVDYVGRAHTSHGADPHIYIAERYVIGQVGFIQHAIGEILNKELGQTEEAQAVSEAWDKLMMVLLEMLSRAYGEEKDRETFDPLVSVDPVAVAQMVEEVYQHEHAEVKPPRTQAVVVAQQEEIPEGERKIVQVDGLSIGIFHHQGAWYALLNSCLHRGGPVATGCLEGNTLTCPWHGFEYDLTSGALLVDSSARLESFPVSVVNDQVILQMPVLEEQPARQQAMDELAENEFLPSELAPGKMKAVRLDDQEVVVYNVDGAFHATSRLCTHAGGPLEEGELQGKTIVCPWHGSCFNVTTGAVECGPAKEPLRAYRVQIEGERARVIT
jgi:nitrite reductase/ring-hydroxylating ferredoxin subunit/hemoglobin-like flavoprotein